MKSLTESVFGLHPGALSEPIIGRSSEALADARAAFVVASVLMAPDRLKREIAKEAGLTESGLHYARTRGQYMLQTDRAFRAKVARIVQGRMK